MAQDLFDAAGVWPLEGEERGLDVPPFFANPYRHPEPGPLLRSIAARVQTMLATGAIAEGHGTDLLERPEGGKMFGLLLVRRHGGSDVGYLRAFSGQLGFRWGVPGWAPPIFDVPERLEYQNAIEHRIHQITLGLRALESSGEGQTRRANAHRRLRRFLSRRAMRDIFDFSWLRNGLGQRSGLRRLYGSALPPWGGGDCAAPKLLVHAWTRGLEPLALAEFWWGPSPRGGGRRQGEFYAPCQLKCGPLLPFLLQGVGPGARSLTPVPAWRRTGTPERSEEKATVPERVLTSAAPVR